ncbi:MAG TPA: TonB-dependent receptor [Sphingopyxis sp.]|jgi:outer membrane receptor protein involved in Fe transport|uniref:TonB-dependent receptor domain-containing protein n=1 Tax=Sphingopyxis sp. TaxID=1908224 RepID=UPI002E116CEF|nr:TonB-dependent receptor [Sphingopyxis sp.]
MKKSSLLLRGTALSLALLGATPAFAQNDPVAPSDAAEEASDGNVIVVTGSRILNRPNLEASIPITSVDAEDLLGTGELSLGDMLNRLPQLRSTFTQANSTANIGTSGLNLLDLRGLGTTRTLVLVNGRRSVTSTPGTYRVDTNTIPTELLERVDLVTGGNSAVYGSDAISGVVNFILKRDYDGFAVNAQGGVSSRGDRGSHQISAVFGRNFADGRGNIAISGGYANSRTLLFSDRNAQTGAFTGTPGFATVDNTFGEPPAGDGIPDTAFFDAFPGATFGNASLGGAVSVSCPAPTATNAAQRALVCAPGLTPTGTRIADNYMFQPDGTLLRNVPAIDLRQVGGGIRGGLGASGVEGAMLLPGLKRYNATLLARYEFSPAAEVFFEGKYVNITANQTSTQPVALSLGGTTSTFFLDNPYLTPQAFSTLQSIFNTTSTTGGFTMIRFLNDIGTRTEDHERETWSLVGGVRGDISSSGNLRYEVALNWGRTETYYEAGGHFISAKFNNAVNAVRSNGQIVCRINADAITTNDDPNCRPINLFGEGAPQTTPDGLAYASYTPFREQWAEMFNATAFISGDTSGLFELPGGPIGFAVGVEYRKEDAFSGYDAETAAGRTTLNAFAAFDPPSITSKELYGEIRIPLLADMPLAKELTVEASGRMSDYSNIAKKVYAYNVGVIYSPLNGVRLRAGYARSVRTPNLSDNYAAQAETFQNGFIDPCSQTVINQNPNRARNCAAAGIPTVLQLPDGTTTPWVNTPASGLSGFNEGNLNLTPEIGKNLTFGAVFQPRFIPGLSLSVDYYRIKIDKAISSLTGQTLINRCYDDSVGIDNIYCAAISRRSTPGNPITDFTFDGQTNRTVGGFPQFNFARLGPSFINRPLNYASFKASGIDAQLDYTYRFNEDVRISLNGALSWIENREFFTSIADPTFSDRVHGELGDPIWEGSLGVTLVAGAWDIDYDFRWIGKQAIATWETQHSHQGRPPTNADAFPVKYYPSIGYVDMQVGYTVDKNFRFFVGMDNVFDTLPPWGLTGTGDASAIFPVTGRYMYAGAKFKF